MIELGGNIKLKGFNDLDAASLIVVKKIVGNYAKGLAQSNEDFKELLLELNTEGKSKFQINANFSKTSGNISNKADGNNLFFTISAALEGISKKE